jgi:hypothetical protein
MLPFVFIPQHQALDAWNTARDRQTVTYEFHLRDTTLAKCSSGRYQLPLLPQDYRPNESIQAVTLLNVSYSNLHRSDGCPSSGFLCSVEMSPEKGRPYSELAVPWKIRNLIPSSEKWVAIGLEAGWALCAVWKLLRRERTLSPVRNWTRISGFSYSPVRQVLLWSYSVCISFKYCSYVTAFKRANAECCCKVALSQIPTSSCGVGGMSDRT